MASRRWGDDVKRSEGWINLNKRSQAHIGQFKKNPGMNRGQEMRNVIVMDVAARVYGLLFILPPNAN
jgi:hypothetical protein